MPINSTSAVNNFGSFVLAANDLNSAWQTLNDPNSTGEQNAAAVAAAANAVMGAMAQGAAMELKGSASIDFLAR